MIFEPKVSSLAYTKNYDFFNALAVIIESSSSYIYTLNFSLNVVDLNFLVSWHGIKKKYFVKNILLKIFLVRRPFPSYNLRNDFLRIDSFVFINNIFLM